MAEEVTTLNNLLVNEIGSQLDFLSEATPGTEEHEKAVKDISTLYKVYNDENDLANKYEEIENRKKTDAERIAFEREKLEFEKTKLEFEKTKLEFEQKQASTNDKKERINKIVDICIFAAETGVKILSIVVPIRFYKRMFAAGLEFERDGSISSKFFGNFVNKMKPNRVD